MTYYTAFNKYSKITFYWILKGIVSPSDLLDYIKYN